MNRIVIKLTQTIQKIIKKSCFITSSVLMSIYFLAAQTIIPMIIASTTIPKTARHTFFFLALFWNYIKSKLNEIKSKGKLKYNEMCTSKNIQCDNSYLVNFCLSQLICSIMNTYCCVVNVCFDRVDCVTLLVYHRC